MQKQNDGDLYKLIFVGGRIFEIRYGYYEEFEREGGDPVPIYPDLGSTPVYGTDGRRIVTAMQDVCDHFLGECGELGCYGCRHYRCVDDLIGICNNIENKKK
jgi:hypothetical protein